MLISNIRNHRFISYQQQITYPHSSDQLLTSSPSMKLQTINFKQYFHASTKELDNLILTPRIPNANTVKNGLENNMTKRVCLSDFIDGCLMAMSCSFEEMKDPIHIYELDYDYSTPIIKEIDCSEVPDQAITREVWALNEIKLKKCMKIQVTGAKDYKWCWFDYCGGHNSLVNIPLWEWKVVK